MYRGRSSPALSSMSVMSETQGRHLDRARDINQPFPENGFDFNPLLNTNSIPAALIAPYPGYSSIRQQENTASSTYNSLQVSFKRRMSEACCLRRHTPGQKRLPTQAGSARLLRTVMICERSAAWPHSIARMCSFSITYTTCRSSGRSGGSWEKHWEAGAIRHHAVPERAADKYRSNGRYGRIGKQTERRAGN